MENTKQVLSITLILLLSVFLYGQISRPFVSVETNPQNERRLNTVIWETTYDPLYRDPHTEGGCIYDYDNSGCSLSNIYETLFTYDFDSANTTQLIPLLAESVDISDDGLNYTFALHQNVRFHDGTPFNATCVQMNFWRMLGRVWVWMVAEHILGGQAVWNAFYDYGYNSPEHIAAWTDWVENSDAIIVMDEFTVRIRLAYPYTPFLSVIAHPKCSIISPTFFMAHGGMAPMGPIYSLPSTCGTGPYRLVWWNRTYHPDYSGMVNYSSIELTLFEDYWRADTARFTRLRAGSISNVIIKYECDLDYARMILDIKGGFTDGCDWPASHVYDIWNNITTRGDGTLQSLNPEVKVWTGNPIYRGVMIGFNMNPYLPEYSGAIRVPGEQLSIPVHFPPRQNPFADYELRAAVSYAFDYQSAIDYSCNGLGVQLLGPILQGMFAHDDELYMFEHNMTEAVTHWNLAMANGLDEVLANNSYELDICFDEEFGFLVKQAIENIIAHPDSIDPSSPLNFTFYVGLWDPLNHDHVLFIFHRLAMDYADPDNLVAQIVRSTSRHDLFNDSHMGNRIGLAGSTGESGAFWDHETVDGWIDAAAAESDPAERLSLYSRIQEAIVEHCAYIWCFQEVEFHVERCEMNGYVFNPMRDLYFFHYYKSYPDPQIVSITSAAIVIFAITIVILKNPLDKLNKRSDGKRRRVVQEEEPEAVRVSIAYTLLSRIKESRWNIFRKKKKSV